MTYLSRDEIKEKLFDDLGNGISLLPILSIEFYGPKWALGKKNIASKSYKIVNTALYTAVTKA
jgi:hypothetical protein